MYHRSKNGRRTRSAPRNGHSRKQKGCVSSAWFSPISLGYAARDGLSRFSTIGRIDSKWPFQAESALHKSDPGGDVEKRQGDNVALQILNRATNAIIFTFGLFETMLPVVRLFKIIAPGRGEDDACCIGEDRSESFAEWDVAKGLEPDRSIQKPSVVENSWALIRHARQISLCHLQGAPQKGSHVDPGQSRSAACSFVLHDTQARLRYDQVTTFGKRVNQGRFTTAGAPCDEDMIGQIARMSSIVR